MRLDDYAIVIVPPLTSRFVAATALIASLCLLMARPALAQDPVADFRANCVSCHTIGGGRLVGPDLKDVAQRRDRAWLARFIANPKATLDSGDPYALQLQTDARGIIMPTLPLPAARIDALLDLIDVESKLSKSRFAGQPISDRPFGPDDIAHGQRLFTGGDTLSGGAPSCLSCHSVEGLTSFGGGSLGPDLTKAFERLGGRRALTTWLNAPATPTMQAVFTSRPLESGEIEGLVAYLQYQTQFYDPPPPRQIFIGAGLGGACVLLWGLNALWSKRLHAVRRPMVQSAAIKG